MDWILDLLISCTHHSKLQALTALSLISTLYKSPQHSLSLFQYAMSWQAIPWQRVLTVEILQLPALRSSCRSHPCRTLVNCQFNYSAISSQPSLQSSTELTTLNCLSIILTAISRDSKFPEPAWGPRYIASGRTQQKIPSLNNMSIVGRWLVAETCLPNRPVSDNSSTVAWVYVAGITQLLLWLHSSCHEQICHNVVTC
jgi:hypothetical protein